MPIRQTIRSALPHVATFILIVGLAWGVARPHAEEFIDGRIKDQVDERLGTLERQIQSLDRSQSEERLARQRIESDLATLKDLQRESRSDVKEILRALRQVQ